MFVENDALRVQERGARCASSGRDGFTAEPGVVHWHVAMPGEPLTRCH